MGKNARRADGESGEAAAVASAGDEGNGRRLRSGRRDLKSGGDDIYTDKNFRFIENKEVDLE